MATSTDAPTPVIPTDTTLPTETPLPPAPETPTPTETVLFTAAFTFRPTYTDLPGVEVRIRNMTGETVNLYRHGLSGEIHFLGWLGHGYYGLFRFPSLRDWKIRYCVRAEDGSDLECREKVINFEEEGKEYRVP
jgi:hypothetical protein